jgi:CBS-domain-containing membrane protein
LIIVVEWQSFELKLSPTDPVRRWMYAAPTTVNATTKIEDCAARMRQARIHSLVVTDDERHVIGILNSLAGLDAISELAGRTFED